jgi:GNAT superfamily N-acetyltransferase
MIQKMRTPGCRSFYRTIVDNTEPFVILNIRMLIRTARIDELPRLEDVVARSFRALGAGHYSPEEIEGALRHRLIRVDPRLVEAGGYFVAEVGGVAAGCGGWSDAVPTVPGLPLPSPRAEVRAMFVAPEFAGRGVGRALLQAAEQAAAHAGYPRAHLVATLSGRAFYLAAGYTPLSDHAVPIPGGGVIRVTCMAREI